MLHFPCPIAISFPRLDSSSPVVGVRGFTLIELMVVIAIIAIVSAIALPNYSYYLIRSRIPEATSVLANKRVRMELFYDNNRTYANAPDCAPDGASSRSFTFEGNCAPTVYTLTAHGTGVMADFVYTIDQNNAKATTRVPTGWTSNANCWVTAKGGGC